MKISFLDLEFMLLLLNLIAFIISIEKEASLLALAKSIYYYCLGLGLGTIGDFSSWFSG